MDIPYLQDIKRIRSISCGTFYSKDVFFGQCLLRIPLYKPISEIGGTNHVRNLYE